MSSGTGLGLIQFGDNNDANIGQITYDHTNNALQLTANGSNVLYAASNGSIGLGGISNPEFPLDFGASTGPKIALFDQNSEPDYGIGVENSEFRMSSGGGFTWRNNGYSTGSEIMILDRDGNVRFNGSNDNNPANNGIAGIAIASEFNQINWARDGAGACNIGINGTTGDIVVYRDDGSPVGSVSTDGSNASFNTSSDKRFKNNPRAIEGAVERVLQTNFVSFEWVQTGKTGEGILAQDEVERWPNVVGMNDEGYYHADYAKMVPALGSALSAALHRIEALEAKLN
jgi:hypothetical protein